MSPDLTVRAAQLSDVDDLVRLLELMHDGVRETPASAREVELLEEILSQQNRQLFVAVTGGQTVGTVDIVVVSNLSRDGSPWAVVENLVVDPSKRRLGIGRALMTAAIDYAEGSGCYKIQLVSNSARANAQALYRSLGFSAPVDGFRRYLKTVAVV
ncbi:GNAT family N-acetyltransferase [Micromonospora sp. NPDC005215]|uniref:GNAT family N-acetyltransferase n=1 Tax=Micromonospora sp. NPDC005215 TaxID=3157024 RepID=UPI0033A1C383